MPIFHPSNRRLIPWKNGGGTTLEIASDSVAPGSDWSWRLSIADLPQRSAFSLYPAVDRFLLQLDGEQLAIERGGVTEIVPRVGAALPFAGEEHVVGIPTGVGVRDVNLMLLRNRWRGAMTLLRGGFMKCDAAIVLVHAAYGTAILQTSQEPNDTILLQDETLMSYERVETKCDFNTAIIVCQLWPVT